MLRILRGCFRASVALAIGVIFVGGALFLREHGADIHDYIIFRGEPESLCGVCGIVQEAWNRNSLGIIQLGIVLLMITPLVRIVFSLVMFAEEKDILYVGIASFVLAVLVGALVIR